MNRQANILEEIADQVMLERDFWIEFSTEINEEVEKIKQTSAELSPSVNERNLTQMAWISIDNEDSKDLDQLTYAETFGDYERIYIAIAEVTWLVKKDTAIDVYAAHNTTSVYVPSKVYPLLPIELSTDLTSLNEHVDRKAIVVEMQVDSYGAFSLVDVYHARVNNHAKLAYGNVTEWLEKNAPLGNDKETPTIAQQLRLQDNIAGKIKRYRESQGALSFKTARLQAVVSNGTPTSLETANSERANQLIENFMIAANVGLTTYMIDKRLPILQRVVRAPKRWDRIVSLAKEHHFTLPNEPDAKALRDFLTQRKKIDPLHFQDLSLAVIKLIGKGEYTVGMPGSPLIGHFDLALNIYAHTTAPNRRYPDFIMQRLLSSYLDGLPPPYTEEQLLTITKRCTQKESDATKVERRVLKSAAAMVLEHQIGHAFPAMVTGVNENGTWIRLLAPPIEGKLNHHQNFDVGDYLKVKLTRADVQSGFLDFVPLE